MKKLFITLITLLLIFILILLTINFSRAATITSVQSGNWSNNNTWDCACVPGPGDNVVIGTHIITVNNNFSATDIDVTVGGILTSNGKTLTVTGDLTIDGFIGGSIKLTITGTNNIDGSGVISTTGSITLTGGNKTILGGTSIDNSQATLSVIIIDAGVTITNDGFWISGAEIKGNAASSTWVQGAGSGLRVGNKMLTTGTFDASGAGNTVEYYEDGNQNIKTASGAYYHLTLSGSGNKNLAAAIDINGNLNISGCTFNPNGFGVNIGGNWTSTGSFTEGTGAVIFDGSSDQRISVPGGETFYDIESNNSGSGIISQENIVVTNSLTMTSGNIDMGGSRFTLGTSAANLGTLTHSAGSVIGEFERWHTPDFNFYDFPVGTVNFERPAAFTNWSLLNPGAAAGSMIIKFVENAPGNNGLSLVDPSGPTTVYNTFSEGYWDVQIANGLTIGTTGSTMIFTGNGFTSFIVDATTRALYRPNAASPWAISGDFGINSGNDVVRAAIPDGNYPGQWALADITNCTAPTAPVITGSNAVCNGDAGAVYSVVGSDTYSWTVSGGTISGGQGTNNLTVDWGVTTGIWSVEVVASNGCTSAFPVTYEVKVGPLPTSSPPAGKTNVADFTTGEPYSVINEPGYTYAWTIIGGTIASGQSTSSITVDWGAEGTGNVSVVGSNGCGSAPAEAFDVTIYDAIESDKTGNYGNNNTWTCSCSPLTTESFRIMPTHAVRLTGNSTISNVTIEPGGILNLNGNDLTVTGDITMHGFVIGIGNIIFSGNAKLIDGAGLFQNTGDISITGGSKTMVAPTALSKVDGDLTIANDITVANNGVFTIDGSVTGGNVNSRFINAGNSTLSVAGTLLSTGTLVSNASINTVNYTGFLDQTIFPTTYYHLGTSGDGIKSLSVNADINGNLQVSEDASLDVTASDFSINLAGDWTNTSIDADPFVERTSSVTFDGSSLQTLTAASGETFNNFIINNAAGATLNDQLTISNNLTLSNGIINTSASNELIIADDATTNVATNSSHVDGPMDKVGDDAFVFPVGDGGNYQAIEISAPGATSDRFRAQYFQTGHTNQTMMDITLDHVSAKEYWDLGLVNGSPTINVTMHWDLYSEASTVPGELADLRAAHELAANWTDEGNDGTTWDGTNGTIVVNGISSFSPWTLASISSNNPLPITLLDFHAKQNEGFIDIKWSTAKEINNDYFTVEKRSEFADDFLPIGRIEGQGNSTKTNHYSFQDTYTLPGFNYYRLKQTDFSGEYTYSKIIVVQVDDFSKFVLYPNPSQGTLNIKIPNFTDKYTLTVFDKFGSEILSKELYNQSDCRDIETHINPGIYLIRITNGINSFGQKFVVRK